MDFRHSLAVASYIESPESSWLESGYISFIHHRDQREGDRLYCPKCFSGIITVNPQNKPVR